MTGLALVAYLASVCGFPLPQLGAVDVSTPFPCQNHHCGCTSAAQCWNNCCCFTPSERLAWARQHHVPIPIEVQLALAHKQNSHQAQKRDRCCSDHDHDHDAATADHACGNCKVRENSSGSRWVLGIQARKCQGLSTLWIVIGAALPFAIMPLWEFDAAPTGRVSHAHDKLLEVAYRPPVPPPRA